MNWRAGVIWFLVVFSLINAVMRLWGSWPTFIAVLVGQAYFIFGGIYPYLYNKTILSFPGAVDAKFDPEDPENSLTRSILLFGHSFLYCFMFIASS